VPIYDYRCTRCGREVEVSHAIGAPGPESCSACGGPMKKALSAPAIHFKGSGWAKKDARTAAPAATKAADEGSPAPGDAAAASSTDRVSEPAVPASGAETKGGSDTGPARSATKASSSSKAG
jgi:putative FmdB family regulatory protein